ncbi:leader peptidase (prepilin peptidase) / N-methyltransferase [Roseivivax lentus]|uniref:Prepilin leader peptidase/N-methyltransferase n=1 Tax=Roseivivax lentus TaxID=633194 RepID=A0A1N7NB02_9RHOB|nr:A24 family peptidase [Roseivivax lentus]SIS95510.1 leader peptidase (prepilin peptidase) / N-methyltransferase [Roseivivax lentus]
MSVPGDLIFAVWLMALGAVGGSAMGACADRLKAGRSWVRGRSACEDCAHPIASADLVPIVSFLRLKGQCRNCHAALPGRLLAVEIAGVLCAVLALVVAQGPAAQIAGTVFLLSLLGLFLCDLRTMRLPDVLTGALAIAGLWVGALAHGLANAALAAIIGVAAFYALAAGYRFLRGREGLGQGDIKMMAGLSAMAGPLGIPWLTLLAALSALIVTAVRNEPMSATSRVPLGCYLAVAGAAVWVATSVGLL